jgi:hypothetical protein
VSTSQTPRCAAFARELEADPCGSSGSYDGFLLIAAPPPWPRDTGELTDDAGELAAAREQGWRVQAVGGHEPATGVVARFWKGADGSYVSDQDARHVLICTHGRRDRCCGSGGTRLYEQVAPGWRRPEQLWRTSHLGGHRFAPTALILPEGTMWAFLDPPTLAAIVDRSADVGQVGRYYRGCTLLTDRRMQLADRCALERVGWSWLDSSRRGAVLAFNDQGALIEVANAERRFVVQVELHRHVPVPKCGEAADAATASEPEYRVAAVTAC